MKDCSQLAYKGLYRLLLLFSLLFVRYHANAQSMSVESFKLLENDLTANTYGTIERDQNGEVAALIKIITTETGFAFDGGMLGIVKTEQKVAEVWVYVPRGLQRIKIMHQQLGQMEYYFPITIESARTYEMRLISGRVRTIIQDEVTAQWVTFKVTPQNAIVTLDNNPYGLQPDGTVSQLLPYGTHSYRVDAPGYISENGVVEVGRGDPVTREVSLKSSRGTVTLECSMKEAQIYVNGNLVGTGSWTGQLDAAMYQVEIKRDGHTTRTTSFTLQPQDEKTITLPVPQPLYGTLSVSSQPIGATVYLDGTEIGTTPFIKSEILAGKKTLEFRKKDYRTVSMEIEIKDGELNSFSTTLSDGFTATINTEPSGASLQVDGQYKGQTPYSFETSSGDYAINLSKPGYTPFKKKIHFDASNPELSIKLPRKILSKTNVYFGVTYQAIYQSGVEASAGAYLSGFNIEGDYHILFDALSQVWWIDNPDSWSGKTDQNYDYSLKNAYSVHAGYGILLNNRFRITPRVGAIFNQIKGSPTNPYSKGQDEQTYVVSGRAGLRMEFSPATHFAFICTPAFDMPVSMGTLASKLDESTDIIRQWCGGFSINAGLEIYF